MKLTRKQRKMLIRIITALVLLIAASVITKNVSALPEIAVAGIYLLPFLAAGYDVVLKAIRNIGHGQIFDENFLMSVATIGAMLIGDYSEGAAVMLFYQVGELFQSIATARSRRSIADLMDIRPDSAAVIRDGERVEIHPSEVQIGETIEIRPGEKVPIDCVIVSGESSLNSAALTGESVPRDVSVGDEILSGCVNISGVLTCRTTKLFGESTASKILELVENASSRKAKAENFITKFARIYTPAVVGAAALLAIIPPLVTGGGFSKWIVRALTFLVVSCPCALVISIPMSFFGGIGGASRRGVLVKGGSYMETLAKAETIVFDKTGTLTKGEFSVSGVYPEDCSESELIRIAAAAESASNHPIARSLVKAAEERGIEIPTVSDYSEISGKGIKCSLGGEEICAGNLRLLGGSSPAKKIDGTAVYVTRGGKYIGAIEISDTVKTNSAQAVSELKKMGIKTIILTGDSDAAAQKVSKALGVDEVYSQLLPEDKVNQTERIISESGSGSVAFAGDGINDAPALSRADIGIAMGAVGSDAAIEAADIVLMDDDPMGIVTAMAVSRKTIGIVRQNIVFALGVKALVLVTSAFGITNMWAAVFADVGVAAIAILNAMRALDTKKI